MTEQIDAEPTAFDEVDDGWVEGYAIRQEGPRPQPGSMGPCIPTFPYPFPKPAPRARR